ncbi:MAG: Gfo/Idh/MocA family oxidoreductase, partial [Clostridia bacterium]|nr:Gfo/Idh/MocA family oxidoreductase [Clostridia bacterium]
MNKVKIAVIGAGGRGNVYANYVATNPHTAGIVAVADPQKHLRDKMQEKFNVPKENLFETYDDFFAKGVIADALIIATHDDM